MTSLLRPTATALLACLANAALARNATAQQAPACSSDSAYHALDFWVGAWNVVDSSGARLGSNRIEKVLGDCAITETWSDADGSEGRSLFYYLPAQKRWKQVWVTPAALMTGGVKEKALVAAANGRARFQGELVGPNGAIILDRTTLTSLPGGRVRQLIEISRDKGVTWRTTFNGIYEPPSAPSVRAEGDSAIAHADWRKLVAVYRPAAAADSTNGMAWFRLGVGLRELAQYDDAIDALRHAVRAKFQPGQAELHIARSFAKRSARDSAVTHIERAIAAGVPIDLITTEPDFAPLAGDRRYASVIAPADSAAHSCRSMPEARQFDFWVGEWDVTPWAGSSVSLGRRATNRVTSELANCVVHEHWLAATGAKGESINFWDPNRLAWRQIWMDEHQWSLDYEGQYADGAMRFHGWTLGPNGQRRLEKLTFFNVAPDTVRQTFEQSADSGKTWSVTFDGRYVRIKRPSSK